MGYTPNEPLVDIGTSSITLQAGDNVIGRVLLTDSVIIATLRDLVGAKALDVAIVDGSGAQITSFGGGTQYLEGTVTSSIIGTAAMWEDTGETLRPISAAFPLPVNVVAGGGGGGGMAGKLDDGPFTVASDSVMPFGAYYDDTSPDTVNEGDVGIVRMASDRILLQDLRRVTNVVSTVNSTEAALGSSSAFVGTAEDVTNYAAISLAAQADQSSSVYGLAVQWSSNSGSNWDREERWSYVANKPFGVVLRPKGTHYRVVYNNAGSAQSAFRLKSVLHVVPPVEQREPDNGRVLIDGVSYPVKWSAINATASGDNTVIAAVSGKKLRILGITFTCADNITITFKSGSNTLIEAMSFAKFGGMAINDLPAGQWVETNAGEAFIMNLSATKNIRGRCYYVEV